MRNEFLGCHLARSIDLFPLYIVMNLGRGFAPANFAIFGDTVSGIRAEFGMGRPGWFLPMPPRPAMTVYDGLLFDIRNSIRQKSNVPTWETIAIGCSGAVSINHPNLEEEGNRAHIRPILGFDIGAASIHIYQQEEKIAGDRVLFDRLGGLRIICTGTGRAPTDSGRYRTHSGFQCFVGILRGRSPFFYSTPTSGKYGLLALFQNCGGRFGHHVARFQRNAAMATMGGFFHWYLRPIINAW